MGLQSSNIIYYFPLLGKELTDPQFNDGCIKLPGLSIVKQFIVKIVIVDPYKELGKERNLIIIIIEETDNTNTTELKSTPHGRRI